MVTGDVIFAATGVTDGTLLPGIRREPGWVDHRDAADALQDRLGAADGLPHPGQLIAPDAGTGEAGGVARG